MIRTELEKVFIEHCVRCKTHQWCTNHDENKYVQYFTMCKNAINRTCSLVTVAENEIPLGFQGKFVTDPNTSQFGKYHFPRIGSFEVYFRGKLIFSKIESMKWPHPGIIAEKIKDIQEAPQKAQARKKAPKGKRMKSAMPFKRKKAKKGRKKIIKAAINDDYFLPSIDVKDRQIRHDQPIRGVKNRQIELPKYSVDMDQSLEYEKPAHQNLAFKSSQKNDRIIENTEKTKGPNPENNRQNDHVSRENKPEAPIFVEKKPTPDIKIDDGKSKNFLPDDENYRSQHMDVKEKKSYDGIEKNDHSGLKKSSLESGSDRYGLSENSAKGFGEDEENVDYMEIMKKYPENFEKDPELEGFVKRTMEAQAKSREKLKEKSVRSEDYNDNSSEHSKENYENPSDEGYSDEDMEKDHLEEKKNSDKDDENYSDEDYEGNKKLEKSDREDENKLEKSDHEEYTDEDYESDKKSSKKDDEKYSHEDYEDEKNDIKNEEEEYNSEDYEDEKKSEKTDDEKYGNEDFEDQNKSEQDYENEKKSEKSENEDYEEEQNEENSYNDENYEEDSEHNDKSSNSEKAEKQSSTSSKNDDYNDADFEEDHSQHPLRPIDKSYNVQLPLNEECKKKITYQNIGDNPATFFIESSHPDDMNIKETEIYIEKGKKGKIQLRFAPMMNSDEKRFYLYIDRNGKPWECIEIVTECEE